MIYDEEIGIIEYQCQYCMNKYEDEDVAWNCAKQCLLENLDLNAVVEKVSYRQRYACTDCDREFKSEQQAVDHVKACKMEKAANAPGQKILNLVKH